MTQVIRVLEEVDGIMKMRKVLAVCNKHGETEHCQIGDSTPSCFKCADDRAAAKKIEEAERAKKEARDRFFYTLEQNGIDPKGKKFDQWEYDENQKARQEKIVDALNRYASNYQSELPNVLLIGGTGSGKTMLANAIAKKVFAKLCKPSYSFVNGEYRTSLFNEINPAHLIKSSDITKKAKATWGNADASEDALIEQWGSYPLLVIDDLGDGDTTSSREHAAADRERIGQIIDKRYQKAPTVITTNMSEKETAEFLGDRAWDRLQEKLVVIKCDWASYRQANAKVSYL